jgi:hypothetical protein
MKILIDKKARRSGETVRKRGSYASSCCGDEHTFEVGKSYTRCLKCMGLCIWEFDDDAAATEDFDYIEPMAA